MAFPTNLTNAVDGVPGVGTQIIAAHLNNLEAKVGIDGSADTASLDYKLKNTASLDPGHKHSALWASDGSPQAVYVDAAGYVGINQPTPTSLLHVIETSTFVGSGSKYLAALSYTITPASAQAADTHHLGLSSTITASGTQTKHMIRGLEGQAYNTGTGTLTDMFGIVAYCTCTGVNTTTTTINSLSAYAQFDVGNSHNITTFNGLSVWADHYGTGTVSLFRGINVNLGKTGSCTYTTFRAINIEGTVTAGTRHAIYNDTAWDNYLGTGGNTYYDGNFIQSNSAGYVQNEMKYTGTGQYYGVALIMQTTQPNILYKIMAFKDTAGTGGNTAFEIRKEDGGSNYLYLFAFDGSTNNLKFNNGKSAGWSYGDVYVSNGNFIVYSGKLAVGSNAPTANCPVRISNIPSSNSGLAYGEIWYDPGAGNALKYISA